MMVVYLVTADMGREIVDAADDVDRAFDEEHDGSHQRTYDGKEGGEASAVEELFEKECLLTFEVQNGGKADGTRAQFGEEEPIDGVQSALALQMRAQPLGFAIVDHARRIFVLK